MNAVELKRAEFVRVLAELEARGAPREIPSSRRYYRDRWHPYGWEIGFRSSVVFPDGQRVRVMFSDIGTCRSTAVANALRDLRGDCIFFAHPEAAAIYSEIKLMEGVK